MTSQDSTRCVEGPDSFPPSLTAGTKWQASAIAGCLWGEEEVCPSPCASLCLQRMSSFCTCQTDVGGGRAASTQHRGLAGGCWQLPVAAQEMSPAVNVSDVINEPSVCPQDGGERGWCPGGAGDAVGSSLASLM